MDRARIQSLVLGLLTIVAMVIVGAAMKKGWLDTVIGEGLLALGGAFLMTIRSWMKEPFPKPAEPKEPPNVAGIVLAIAVGSVIASTPFALCSCSPAANRQAQAEAKVDIEVGTYTVAVAKCRTVSREGFNACVATGGEKLACKAKWLAEFDKCACGVDATYHNDAGECQ